MSLPDWWRRPAVGMHAELSITNINLLESGAGILAEQIQLLNSASGLTIELKSLPRIFKAAESTSIRHTRAKFPSISLNL